jgi:hypothetical protein
MTNKIYNILLDNIKIGTTELEKADAPMGVVFGRINFINIDSGYDFFKTYCISNNFDIVADYPDERLITTPYLSKLKVIDQKGVEIKGQGTNIEGMDSEFYEIIIDAIPYPFYEEEFPHHVKFYNEMFKK